MNNIWKLGMSSSFNVANLLIVLSLFQPCQYQFPVHLRIKWLFHYFLLILYNSESVSMKIFHFNWWGILLMFPKLVEDARSLRGAPYWQWLWIQGNLCRWVTEKVWPAVRKMTSIILLIVTVKFRWIKVDYCWKL